MKREAKTIVTTDVTYTFTREEVVAALCEVHGISLDTGRRGQRHAVVAAESPENGFTISLQYEELAPVAYAVPEIQEEEAA